MISVGTDKVCNILYIHYIWGRIAFMNINYIHYSTWGMIAFMNINYIYTLYYMGYDCLIEY